MPLIIIILLCLMALFGLHVLLKSAKRIRLLQTPLTAQQRTILMAHVPLFRKIPDVFRVSLEGKINLFLDQIDFIGCDGLDVTDEMRLSIAAQACILVANKTQWYDTLRTILIYPHAFTSRTTTHDGFVVTEGASTRTGESWARGPVVLSWYHSARGAFIDDDGHNVVLHEFTHQLDALSGHTDGAPILGAQFGAWQQVLNEVYDRHVSDVSAGRDTFIDPYGATAPAEFFAVLVETFFETPAALKQQEPAVYSQLSTFFALDPSAWD